jgi:DNA-binding NarL/FixJ family response regulator
VLILTVIYDKEKVSAALDQGAEGYALKDIRPEELVQLIKSTLSGLRVIHQNVFNRMKNQFDMDTIKCKSKSKEKNSVEIGLTQRERSVVRLIVEGKSNKEIAVSLSLSEGRVRNVITDILKKLKLADRTQLAIFAVRNDIV